MKGGSRHPLVIEATLCHIIGPKGLLLKRASRGFSRGKWNAPGGKLEDGESSQENAKREVFEETGLRVRTLFSHGEILYFMNGRNLLHTRAYLFSTRSFSGTPKSTVEGRVRWFGLAGLPFDHMWDDDKYWLALMLSGSKFDARFYFGRGNITVKRFSITPR
jgi:8-oxo-dGTP pyrophosphatase MutT (NUDIX family)